jgi:hypothetical protein
VAQAHVPLFVSDLDASQAETGLFYNRANWEIDRTGSQSGA